MLYEVITPFYVEYMVHEGTALFVAAYAITLLVGLVRLGQGPEAWAGWLDAMNRITSYNVCYTKLLRTHCRQRPGALA